MIPSLACLPTNLKQWIGSLKQSPAIGVGSQHQNPVNRVLLDTDIFSRVLRRYSPEIVARSTAYLANFDRFTISAITVTEIVRGWHKQQREDRVLQLITGLSTVEVLVMELEQFILAGRILADLERTGQPIGLADTLIAAIAIQ